MKIKTLVVAAFACAISSASFAQNTESSTETALGKNLVKINLLSLPLKNFHVQYERAVAKKISVGLGLRLMPKGSLPFSNAISKAIDDEDLSKQIENFSTSNFAITPEVRFYLGKEALKGFYLAPFARYSRYTAAVPYNFEVEFTDGTNTLTREENIPLSGSVNTFTAGLMIGSQFKLSKLISLDWWILGPQYGGAKGSIAGQKTLSPDEQDALRDQLQDLEDLPLVKTTYTVDGNGAKVDFKGPWAGVRAGLCLGVRF
jgi:hypothetical protein